MGGRCSSWNAHGTACNDMIQQQSFVNNISDWSPESLCNAVCWRGMQQKRRSLQPGGEVTGEVEVPPEAPSLHVSSKAAPKISMEAVTIADPPPQQAL